MIFLGCADPESWDEGLRKLWAQEGWIKLSWFDSPFVIRTTGGRTDLVFPFSAAYWAEDGTQVGKLAWWRLSFGDCSWISDYKVNYASQHQHYSLDYSLPISHLNRIRAEERANEEKRKQEKEEEKEEKEEKPVKVRPIARMAPMGSRDMKVKKTVGKPTRRSTREKKVPLRYR